MASSPHTCTICLQETTPTTYVRAGDCTHRFHLICLRQWATVNNSCPLCKRRFTKMVALGGLRVIRVEDAPTQTFSDDDDGIEVFYDDISDSSSSSEEDEDDEDYEEEEEEDTRSSFEDCDAEARHHHHARISAQEVENLETGALSVLGGVACVDKPQSSIGKALLRRKGRRTRARTRDSLTVYSEYSDGTRELLANFPGTDVSRAMGLISLIRRAEAAEESWELSPVVSCEAAPTSSEPAPATWEYAPKDSASCGSRAKSVLRYSIILNE